MIGFLNIIKPTGVSSGLIVNKVKRLTGEKVGHLGTLDPAASGVLTIAVGKATRFFDYFLNKDKEYVALAKFGVLTNTLDSEGEILSRDNQTVVTLEDVAMASERLVGEVDQIPPIFSSKSVDGVRAYQSARQNKKIDLPPKKVQIYSINVEKTQQNDVFKLKIHRSSGTYVRSIVRDIADILGTVATTVCIIRTKSGPFHLENAFTFDEIQGGITSCLMKINDAIKITEIDIDDKDAKFLADGKTIKRDLADGDYLAMCDGKEYSVAHCENGLLKNEIYLYEGEING